jgi:hypothetical protein
MIHDGKIATKLWLVMSTIGTFPNDVDVLFMNKEF